MAEPGGLQWGLDALFSALMGLGGLVVTGIRSDHKDLAEKHDSLVNSLPQTYARRDDVKDGFNELKQSLRRIEDRLGTKENGNGH